MPWDRISLFLTLMFITESFSQPLPPYPLQDVYDRYKNFDYQGVIKSGDQVIKTATNLSRQDSLEIFRLQGLSYYSLADMPGALHCFVSMLKLEPDYQMQVRDNPPKVINFFEEIRRTLIRPEAARGVKEKDLSSGEGKLPEDESPESEFKPRNSTIGYSLILPGLGHLQSGQSGKGWILLASGLVTLGSSIYFTFDTAEKENDYLEATSKEDIEKKYNAYNQAYKLRNTSWLLYAGLWAYTQMDLLFWSKPDFKRISIFPEISNPGYYSCKVQIIF
jgi:hypothetical protein